MNTNIGVFTVVLLFNTTGEEESRRPFWRYETPMLGCIIDSVIEAEHKHRNIAALKDRVLRLLRNLESIYKVLITNRRWFAITSAAVEDFWAKKLYYYSGNFTYNAFLAVIALLVALSALVGIIARSNTTVHVQVLKFLRTLVPIVGAAPKKTLDAMETYSGVVGIAGLIFLAWTGTKLFRGMESGISAIWGSRKRSYVKGKLFGAFMVSLLGVFFLVAFLVQFGFMALWGWLVGKHGFLFDTGNFLIKPLLGFVSSFALFLFIYRVVPTVRQTWRHIAVGAAVSGAVYLAMMYLIAFYYSSISKVPSIYGELFTAIMLIIWLHLTGMIVFFGEEVIYVSQQEALVEEHRKRASEWSFLPKERGPKSGG